MHLLFTDILNDTSQRTILWKQEALYCQTVNYLLCFILGIIFMNFDKKNILSFIEF